MDKKLLWALAACLLVFCLILAGGWWKSARNCKDAQLAYAELQAEAATAIASLDSLQAAIPPGAGAEHNAQFWYRQARRARENQGMLLRKHEIGALQEWGLDDPVEQLRDDLVAHPQLIPFEGVCGGKMHFPRHTITLLSPKWVYAEFSDGHIGGNCLLEFQVNPGGVIIWTVIRAEID